jgi:hypothetical protein
MATGPQELDRKLLDRKLLSCRIDCGGPTSSLASRRHRIEERCK